MFWLHTCASQVAIICRIGRCILAPNHISHFDSALIGNVVRRPLWYMAMQEMFESQSWDPLVRFLRCLPHRTGRRDRSALGYAKNLLNRGQALVVYPEGRLSRMASWGRFAGVTLLACTRRCRCFQSASAAATT
jgi:1-acyl-sn-glycerol-3-phosphate acyltransferase